MFYRSEQIGDATLYLADCMEMLPISADAVVSDPPYGAGYVNGRAGFLDVIDAQRTLLEFELTAIEARTQRELALASLSLAIAGVPPSDAPILRGGASRTSNESIPTPPSQEERP